MHQQQTAFENIVGKEEIAQNEQFPPFPQCFLLNQKIVSPFVNIFDTIFLFADELEEPKIGMRHKGLSTIQILVEHYTKQVFTLSWIHEIYIYFVQQLTDC